MERSFWDRVQDLRESINGGVQPMDTVKLTTRTVKLALGLYLIQSVIIALTWSIQDHSFSPWMIPLSAFLQVGWVWNKVTDSWKVSRGVYQRLPNDLEAGLYHDAPQEPPPVDPPTIILHNTPLTGGGSKKPVKVPLDTQRAYDSIIKTGSDDHPLQWDE